MIRTVREGLAILTSREFWRHFRKFFYRDRFDAWVESVQEWETARKESESNRKITKFPSGE